MAEPSKAALAVAYAMRRRNFKQPASAMISSHAEPAPGGDDAKSIVEAIMAKRTPKVPDELPDEDSLPEELEDPFDVELGEPDPEAQPEDRRAKILKSIFTRVKRNPAEE